MTTNDNLEHLGKYFKESDIPEALDLIKNGDDREPYLSNRLMRICVLLKDKQL